MFETTAQGGYYTNITERALEFAAGDPDRLAAVAVARWLSAFQVDFHWHPDTLRFDAGPWVDVEAKASLLSDPACVRIAPSATYTLAVRVNSGIVCVHGGTYAGRWADLIEQYPDAVPVSQLLTAADWLRSFPHLHTPCAEVAQAKTQAAAAARAKGE